MDQKRKTTYVKLDSVIDIIQQIKQKHIEEQKETDDLMKLAFESAKIGVLTDAHVTIICDIERFTAEQVAAEEAEEMVGAEGVASEIVDVIEDMVRDENTHHILVQGHDRNGWTDEEVLNCESAMLKLRGEIAIANKGHGDIWLYSKGLDGQTFTELRIQMNRIEAVLAEMRRRAQ